MTTFKLQAVLDHRQFVEDSLKKELAEIRVQVDLAEQKLNALKIKEMDTTSRLRTDQTQGISSDQVVSYHAFLRALGDRIRSQQEVLDAMREKEKAKQDEVLDAMKGRQMLEKLKDQEKDRRLRERMKKEMRFIDEIAVNQFVRKALNSHGDQQ